MTWTQRDIEELVERTTREQGLPVKVTDPVVLKQIATLLRTEDKP